VAFGLRGSNMSDFKDEIDSQDEFDKWWCDLRHSMKSKGIREVDDSKFVEQIRLGFQFFGSKIDWDLLDVAADGSIETELSEDPNNIRAAKFFQKVVAKFKLSGEVVCMGDDFMEFGLLGPIEVMAGFLPDLFELPQHTYLCAPDGSWVFCYSMEGYQNFGFRKENRSHG